MKLVLINYIVEKLIVDRLIVDKLIVGTLSHRSVLGVHISCQMCAATGLAVCLFCNE